MPVEPKRIAFIFGTRPEAIKLCPVVAAMREHSAFEPRVCVTGQHREMLDQVLDVFGIVPEVDLALMEPNQTLGSLTSRAVRAVDDYLAGKRPDMVLVEGDTTTVFSAALAAFYRQIPVAHVEAGLRTWNKLSPFPEEMNRVLTTRLADLHFAPTEQAKANLLREGISDDRIVVTGNTVIDALLLTIEKVVASPPVIGDLDEALQPTGQTQAAGVPRVVLITGHRRENFGQGFENICLAIAELAGRFADVHFVYPVHLNPNVREPVTRILGGSASDNIHLLEPLGYLEFVAMMHRSHLLLTDSGGVQEEAPSLGKPVLVMRDTTERPEGVELGCAKLIGTDRQRIVDSVSQLLRDETAHAAMAGVVNPYGDGQATGRILDACERFLDSRGLGT